MKVTKQLLEQAAEKQIIDQKQSQQLYQFFQENSKDGPGLSFTNVLYYLGGLIAIGAMTLFMNLGWESFGGWGVFFISLLYAGVGLTFTQKFIAKELFVPAGICATFVVALTPLAVFGLQVALGLWPESEVQYQDFHRKIQWYWLYMELATLIVGAVMLWRFNFPFLTMPVAVTLWYLTMDVAALLVGEAPDWELRALVSLYLGLAMTLLAFWVDTRTRFTRDYAFWIYLFGVIAFWGGLSLQESDSELSKFFYLLINLTMIIIGTALARKVFVVFGAIGAASYIGYLAFDLFEDSWMFPIALTFVGAAFIYLGLVWQRNETKFAAYLRSFLPVTLQELLSSRH